MIRTTDADGNEVSKITPMMKANGTMETQKEMLARGKKMNACSQCHVVVAEKCKRCARCTSKYARYCSRECQRQHWAKHKKVCGKDGACSFCMERSEHDGCFILCFACGFASCETCRSLWDGHCPDCGADQMKMQGRLGAAAASKSFPPSPPPRNSHVPAAAWPRPASTDYPRRYHAARPARKEARGLTRHARVLIPRAVLCSGPGRVEQRRRAGC